MYVSPNEKFYSAIQFNLSEIFWEGFSPYGQAAPAFKTGGKTYQITHLPETFPKPRSSSCGCPQNWRCTKSDYFLRAQLT